MSEFVTLPQTRLLTGDDVDTQVVDSFAKSSFLFNNLPFHLAAAAQGGTALAYTYTRNLTNPTAAFRELNADYDRSAGEVEQHTVVCKPFGGRFGIDRILAGAGNADQIKYQMNLKIRGAAALFADTVINGDTDALTGNPAAFDGLSVALDGSDTEVDGAALDWSDLSTQVKAYDVVDALNDLLMLVDGSDGLAILVNKDAKARIQAAAMRAGYHTASENAAGTRIDYFNGVPIVDLGAKPGSNNPVIATTTKATDIYVVRMAEDGFHAVAPAGDSIIKTYLPVSDGRVVMDGSVECVAAVALKSQKAAAVLRGVTVNA